jgi:flagellar motor switch protein FliN/FliY
MSSEDPKDAAEDPMAAWAEALEEQKTNDQPADVDQGGPLHSEGMRPFVGKDGTMQDINMVLDIPVTLSVELGRTKVPIKYILQLAQGSVVVNDKFGIRLTDVVTPSERLRRVSRGG